MKLLLIFFAALTTISSCPREQIVKCEKFRLELENVLVSQDDGKCFSYVGYDSLKTTIDKNIDCFKAVDLDSLKNFFPNLKKSESSAQKYHYLMSIANIEKGDILNNLGDISYTSILFQVDSIDQMVIDVKIRNITILEPVMIKSSH